MILTPSPHQTRIYDWVDAGSGSATVIAVAGSGKTTTLAEICRRIPKTDTVRVLMFNKQISDVFKGRVSRSNVIISTYHSAAFGVLTRHLHAKIETDKFKLSDLARSALSKIDEKAYGESLIKLVGLARGSGFGCLEEDTPHAWQALIDHHDLDFELLIPPNTKEEDFDAAMRAEQDRVLDLAHDLLEQANKLAAVPFDWKIDFDDQLYLPILWDLPFPTYDWVLVDEAQDTNAIQREILRRSLKPGGRLIAVGDPNQAIYGWRGASHDAMEKITSAFDAIELPLSVCYRCGAAIVERAQAIVPQIEVAPDAHEGEVCEEVDPAALTGLTPRDAILCRNNAPLVSTAYALIRQGVACQILGRDIGDGLKKLVKKINAEDVEALETQLTLYKNRETARYKRLRQESRAQGVEDRVSCLTTIIESLDTEERTIRAVIAAIDDLFGEGTKDLLTLSTVHKAKGQEWDRVAIIRADLMPSFWAKQAWQHQQERNLMYVAWTRAKRVLWFMDDKPEWLKKKEAREAGEDYISEEPEF